MKKPINPYLQKLHDQIGRMAFWMMGAKDITFDNTKNTLRWKIANSRVKSASVRYDLGTDLYELSFLTETKTTIADIVIEQVEIGNLHATIEQMIGLQLSLTRIYAP